MGVVKIGEDYNEFVRNELDNGMVVPPPANGLSIAMMVDDQHPTIANPQQ